MKVAVYSDRLAQEKNIGWHKDGHNIKYFQNGIKKKENPFS
jgi:hypothetical protein